MSFPNGGVLVCDGIHPYPENTKRRQGLIQETNAFVRSPIDVWPVSLLLPFSGTVVWEEWLGHCIGPEVRDGKTTEHDKVWAACLVATCAEEEMASGRQLCLKWAYHARYGHRRGTIDEHIIRFTCDEKETDQQKAAKRYREKVREQMKKYIAVPFDPSFDPEA